MGVMSVGWAGGVVVLPPPPPPPPPPPEEPPPHPVQRMISSRGSRSKRRCHPPAGETDVGTSEGTRILILSRRQTDNAKLWARNRSSDSEPSFTVNSQSKAKASAPLYDAHVRVKA